jgi:FlaA1/EpsC-like NDP-sugar epimerase
MMTPPLRRSPFLAPAILRHRRALIILTHLVLIPATYLGAFLLRYDGRLPSDAWRAFASTVPYLLVIRFAAFYAFGLFRGWWRHAGLNDLAALAKAVTTSTLVFLSLVFFLGQTAVFPRSVLLLDWGLAVLLFGGLRFAVRVGREGRFRARSSGRRVVMVGAGEAAERLIRSFRREDMQDLAPVALVDDDPLKQGMWIHGIPVVGTTEALARVARQARAEMLVIAVPSASRTEMQRLVNACMETGLDFKIVPSLLELLDGRAKLGQLREVRIEDLLGREPVELDMKPVRDALTGRTVLITGGAGSIGGELARQVAGLRPRRLVLVDQAESPLYYVHLDLLKAHPKLDVVPFVADVTDGPLMERIFREHRPDFVFHAAAYKHVPLMESNPTQAVRNNVYGTLEVARQASACGVGKFVLISTDKAVNPSSVMGATKRISERIVLGWGSLRRSTTDFRAVRFGNVLGSDGSVIPLFQRQLAAGGPVTVTHPEVTRYFMTIPEAVQLVLQASILPDAAGHICMLDMGEPVRIVELAENLVRLAGMEPYRDMPIVFTGLRPGEKLHEQLMSDVEGTVPTEIQKIRIVQTTREPDGEIETRIDRLLAACEVSDRADVLAAIREAVPECIGPLRGAVPRSIPANR